MKSLVALCLLLLLLLLLLLPIAVTAQQQQQLPGPTPSPTPSPAPVTFSLSATGTHHVFVGHYMFFQVTATVISGTDQMGTPSVTGLPAGVSASFPDLTTFCCGTQFWRLSTTQAVRIAAAASTTPGTYPLTITYTTAGGSASIPFQLSVDAVPALPTPTPIPTPPVLSSFPQWQANMTNFGQQHCNPSDFAWVANASDWYYDGVKVYQDIAAYTNNPGTWLPCADGVAAPFVAYILSNVSNSNPPAASIPGYFVWSAGLAQAAVRTGNPQTKTAVQALVNSPVSGYANGSAYSTANISTWYSSRETALAIGAQYSGVVIGGTLGPKFQDLIEIAIGQVNQWFIDKSAAYVQPFMVGITAEQLIHYYQLTKDPRIPYLMQVAADGLMSLWDTASGSWLYNNGNTTSGTTSAAPDLNLIIVPIYGFVYQQTGDAKYLSEGDAAFNAGVSGAYLGSPGAGGKQFSVNYHWSKQYLDWRNPVGTPATNPIPSPVTCGPVLTVANGSVTWPAGKCP